MLASRAIVSQVMRSSFLISLFNLNLILAPKPSERGGADSLTLYPFIGSHWGWDKRNVINRPT